MIDDLVAAADQHDGAGQLVARDGRLDEPAIGAKPAADAGVRAALCARAGA